MSYLSSNDIYMLITFQCSDRPADIIVKWKKCLKRSLNYVNHRLQVNPTIAPVCSFVQLVPLVFPAKSFIKRKKVFLRCRTSNTKIRSQTVLIVKISVNKSARNDFIFCLNNYFISVYIPLSVFDVSKWYRPTDGSSSSGGGGTMWYYYSQRNFEFLTWQIQYCIGWNISSISRLLTVFLDIFMFIGFEKKTS